MRLWDAADQTNVPIQIHKRCQDCLGSNARCFIYVLDRIKKEKIRKAAVHLLSKNLPILEKTSKFRGKIHNGVLP